MSQRTMFYTQTLVRQVKLIFILFKQFVYKLVSPTLNFVR